MLLFSETDLLSYQKNLIVRNIGGRPNVFDPIRKKNIVLLPEELVRQCLLQAIITEKIYPKNLIQVEKTILVNNRKRRFDVVIYNNQVRPFLLIECKSPNIILDQMHADQIFAYNATLEASYFLITNGYSHFCGSINQTSKNVHLIDHFPSLT